MVIERMLFRSRIYINKGTQSTPTFFIKHALAIKIVMHISMIIFIHAQYGFVIPSRTATQMDKSLALVIAYILWVVYFIFSAL